MFALLFACGESPRRADSEPTLSSGAPGLGGSAGALTGGANTGGTLGRGGADGSGGDQGGMLARGGADGSGGDQGGTLGRGGADGSGGDQGGMLARGGADGTGGVSGGVSIGGAVASGGTVATGGAPTSAGGPSSSGGAMSTSCADAKSYDALVLCAHPVGYWAMTEGSGSEPDLSGNANPGGYKGGATALTTLPNGDRAAVFNGSSQYLTIPSKPSYSIPTTSELTWEAWINPSVLQFPNDSGGYVDWLGKCASYSPTCEWEARLYNTDNSQNRCNRFSAYVFNPSAGLGSGADWQPQCGLIQAGTWYHVVGEYTLRSQPSSCQNTSRYPGAIDIFVNGVKWNQARHGETGCMSQYEVSPKANSSPVNVGTMAQDAWFQGAIAKFAIYDVLLSDAEVKAHYRAMTGRDPTGSCANDCSF